MKLSLVFLSLVISLTCYVQKGFSQNSFDRQDGKVIIQTDKGKVSGIANNDLQVFKGIPFAAPPIGDLRWKAPQPVAAWQGVKECAAFGPSPMQREPAAFSMWSMEFLIPKAPISEDCLYLNVWTGAKSPNSKLPVLVWIYGGGFNSGGAGVPIYDGEAMAKKGIVFVSINYRVGVFGFFAHPELTKEAPYHASGNYGLLDQVAALQWVKKNIAAFGGDPSNVTIAGQSAGSMSVNCLVASPLAKGLFNKAIAESGANMVTSAQRPSPNLQDAEKDGLKMAQTLGASSVSELRKMSAEELQKKAQGSRPIVDGYFLPEPIPQIFAKGKQNNVALLTGWNENENYTAEKKLTDFQKQLQDQFGDASTALKYYAANNDVEAAASHARFSRDIVFGVQNYTWANVQSRVNKNVYVYRFTRIVPATGEYKKYGAFHTGEVPYAYDNLKFVDRPWEPVDQELANTMSTYWANFIKTGNPNGGGLPQWPKYSEQKKEIIVLDKKVEAKRMSDAETLDFLYTKMTK